eukprot:CAMPEP_0198140732 /NCGR_PEP_ID=MMETSP1443-20131203/3854_1 /TAXON_ID=186043 /ORGANISM="Entomoneis sp., Strain CCMP2396" /LENGTH=982 /DNA_ID=CAMNT_0043803251 /DNA_START=336 /DNA_END=3284 /DNA_ORIENTATION=-
MPLVSEKSASVQGGGLSSRSTSKYAGGFQMNDATADLMENFADKDGISDKTWSRRLVEGYLSTFKWYFPMRDKENGPKLSIAYAFYEHVTLPRYFSGTEEADHVQRKAERGETEEGTRLFSPWTTKSSSFIEWGIGIDSYFSSLKMASFMLFVAGLLNWYVMRYYASSDYSEDKDGGLSVFLKGSAICSTFEWAVCPNCTSSEFDTNDDTKVKYGVAADGAILVLRNACGDDLLGVGLVNYCTFFLLAICLMLMSAYLTAREIRSDEDKLTATDYSVVVRNPPPDAYNPDAWRDFFEKFATKQVTCVTVAVNNEKMLRKLINRRNHRNNLRLVLPPGTDMDDEDLVQNKIAELEREKDSEPKGCLFHLCNTCIFPLLNTFDMFLPPHTLFEKVVSLTEEVKELQKQEYQVTSVFVTFETEDGQRAALSALSVGEVDIMANNMSSYPGTVFQERVLRVQEPTEPSAVRWLDLSESFTSRILYRVLSLFITLCVVTVTGICVGAARNAVGTGLSGPLVSVFNSIIPYVVKILMMFESHYTEGSYQTSLYLKITLFRWINTAVLVKLITPFTGTITDGGTDVLPSIVAIFYSELFITPALKMFDISGNIKKHILAPRAANPGTDEQQFYWNVLDLGERYTDFSKVLFLCFFYSALFPAGFFFGCAILLVQQITDKYCLMRIWGPTAAIGSQLAVFSRRYFFNGALLAYILVGAFTWAQFPYDNICDPDTNDGNDYSGTYTNVTLLSQTVLDSVSVTQSTDVQFCEQSWRESNVFAFPPTSRLQDGSLSWMSSEQEKLSNIYGWTAVAVLVLFFVIFFGSASMNLFLSMFRNTYTAQGQNQLVDYSSNPEIFAYVPQITLPSFAFPLLACDVDDIYQNLIGWTDEDNSYDYYNLMFDVPYDGMKRTRIMKKNTRGKGQIRDSVNYKENSNSGGVKVGFNSVEVSDNPRPIFSVIKHYPPPWLQKLLDDENVDHADKSKSDESFEED